jgi:uncharacterized protein YceK
MNPHSIATTFVMIVLAACLLVSGCRTIPDPEIPPREKASSSQEANEMMREYQLAKIGHIYWGTYFLQGEKEYRYPYQRISGLFQFSSDEARSAYRKGSNQAIWSYVTAGIGGGLIGYPLGWYIGSKEFSTTELVLLGSGVVSGVISIVLGIIADGNFEDAVVKYNEHLGDTFGAD